MSFKANEIRDELADELKKRLSDLAHVNSFDANANPMITIGAGSALGRNAVIVVKPIDWPLAKDVLGLPATVFTPHVIQLVTEANFAGTTDNVADPLLPQDILVLLSTICKRGTKVEWYQSATSVAPTTAAILTANKKAEIEADLYWTSKSSQ